MIECPWCGEDRLVDCDDVDGVVEECTECGKEYEVNVEHTAIYSTTKPWEEVESALARAESEVINWAKTTSSAGKAYKKHYRNQVNRLNREVERLKERGEWEGS